MAGPGCSGVRSLTVPVGSAGTDLGIWSMDDERMNKLMEGRKMGVRSFAIDEDGFKVVVDGEYFSWSWEMVESKVDISEME